MILFHIKKILNNFIFRKTLGIFFISSFLGIFSYFVPVLIAKFYGISKSTDAFFFTYAIITFALSVFQSIVSTLIVPYVAEKKDNKHDLFLFVNSVFIFTIIVSVILIIIGYLLTYVLSVPKLNLVASYLRIILPIILFIFINGLLRGVLNSLGKYYSSAISNGASMPFVYAALFLCRFSSDMRGVLFGYVVGEIFTFILLFLLIKSVLNKYLNFYDFHFKSIKPFITGSTYLLFGTIASSANPVVDRVVASTLTLGSVTVLDYGQRLFSVLTTILGAFLIVLLTKWSEKIALKKEIFTSVYRLIAYTFVASLIVSLIVILFSKQFVSLLYGDLPKENYFSVLNIFRINTYSFTFIAISQILNRAVLALKSTKIILKVAFLKFFSNIFLDIILAKYFFIEGIALATLLNYIIGFLLLFYFFNKEKINITNKMIINSENTLI